VFTASLYSLVIIVHVACGALLIGSGLSGSLIRARMKAAQSGRELGLWLDFGRQISAGNPVFGLTLLATGIYMGSTGWWSDAWFAVATTLWLVDLTMAVGVIKQSGKTLGMALGKARGVLTAGVVRVRDARAWDVAAAVLRGNNLAMLYLMFVKPGLVEAIAVVVLAQALSFGAYAIESRRQSAAPVPAPAVGV